MGHASFECVGCGNRLRPFHDVRAVDRESADAGPADPEQRWAYVHVGHEPKGYRITGRGRLDDLERNRRAQAQLER